MSIKDKIKNTGLKDALFLSLFVFVRTVVMTQETHFGISFSDSSVSMSASNIVFIGLLILFSVLISYALMKINDKSNNIVSCLCALIIIDPVIFILQNNMLKLIVGIAGILCILNNMKEKPVINKNIMLFVFLFVSTLLIPSSIFSIVPLALTVRFICVMKDLTKVKSHIFNIMLSLLGAFLGLIYNKLLNLKVVSFEKLIGELSFAQTTGIVKSPEMLLSAIPLFIIGIFVFYRYCSCIRKNNAAEKTILPTYTIIVVVATLLMYILAVVGFMLNGYYSAVTINIILPSVFIALVLTNDVAAIETIDQINIFIRKNLFIVLLLTAAYICLSIKLNAGNISTIISSYII